MNWGSKMLHKEVQEKQGGGKWRVGEEEFVLENLFFFLFKDMYNIHVHQQHGNSEQARQRSSTGAAFIGKRKHKIFQFAFKARICL